MLSKPDAPMKDTAGKDLSPEDETKLLQAQSDPVKGYTNVAPAVTTEEAPEQPEDKQVEKPPAKAPEKKAPEQTEDKPEASKKPETPAETPGQKEEPKDDVFDRLERELLKPEGQEDLRGFNRREVAYYHQMKRDRKDRQEAEAELDVQKLQNERLKRALPPEAQDVLAEIEQKDQSDFMTPQEVAAAIKRDRAARAKQEPAPTPDPSKVNPQQQFYLQQCDTACRTAHPDDYDIVMELLPELVNNNPALLAQMDQDAVAGKNPAETAYQAMKAHPDFEKLLPLGEIRWKAVTSVRAHTNGDPSPAPASTPTTKPPAAPAEASVTAEQAAQAQAALESNTSKTRTTAHASGTQDSLPGELSAEDIINMPDAEFRALPRKERMYYLQRFGSAPNMAV
jgi:hypothetical protein